MEEKDQPASVQMTAHAEPLTLLAVVRSFLDTLIWLQLCDPQGVALFPFVCLLPRVRRTFAGAPVYGMSLTHGERLCAVGCGFKGKLVRLLSLGTGCHFQPQSNRRACHNMMQSIVRRVAAGLAAVVRNKVAKEAEELCASGQFAAAEVPLQRAIDFGDLPSCALKAWLLIDERAGVAKDRVVKDRKAFELAEQGARLGCHHCQGVMAFCYWSGCGCEADDVRSLEMARESAGKGSRYGQCALGFREGPEAVAFFRLAAEQGLASAQAKLGEMYDIGYGVVEDIAESQRWYKLAAAQGHPDALYWVAFCHMQRFLQCGCVPADAAESIRWFRRAQVAGHSDAACKLRYLRKLTRSATSPAAVCGGLRVQGQACAPVVAGHGLPL